jgi:hypothetical protein
VHDYFDIIGVARNARPVDVRRVCGRRVHVSHPDVWDGDSGVGRTRETSGAFDRIAPHETYDAAIDFVDTATLVGSMRAGFFASPAAGR